MTLNKSGQVQAIDTVLLHQVKDEMMQDRNSHAILST